MEALEVFGHDGSFHTQNYFNRVKSLEIWEVNESCLPALEENLPGYQIKVVDSFDEIKRTSNRFDLVIIDNPTSTYSNYCEYFELFPDVFGVLKDHGILVINVIPEISPSDKDKMPYLFSDEQLKSRAKFYQAENPKKIDLDHMVTIYAECARLAGYNLVGTFHQKRSFVFYLVLRFEKN